MRSEVPYPDETTLTQALFKFAEPGQRILTDKSDHEIVSGFVRLQESVRVPILGLRIPFIHRNLVEAWLYKGFNPETGHVSLVCVNPKKEIKSMTPEKFAVALRDVYLKQDPDRSHDLFLQSWDPKDYARLRVYDHAEKKPEVYNPNKR